MADKEFLLTQEGLDQHKEELEFLKTTRRTEIAEKLKLPEDSVTFLKMRNTMKLKMNKLK